MFQLAGFQSKGMNAVLSKESLFKIYILIEPLQETTNEMTGVLGEHSDQHVLYCKNMCKLTLKRVVA